jgi:DNA-binding transcriptional ArsR family regulator
MSVETQGLDLLKSLADESRLKLVAILLHGRERSVEELAAMLGLRAPTVSHHLARLRAVGLVSMRAEGNSHLYRLDRGALAAASRDLLSTEQMAGLVRGLGRHEGRPR